MRNAENTPTWRTPRHPASTQRMERPSAGTVVLRRASEREHRRCWRPATDRHLIPAAGGAYWRSLTVENARDIVDDALQAVVAYGLPWLRRKVNVKDNADEPPIR